MTMQYRISQNYNLCHSSKENAWPKHGSIQRVTIADQLKGELSRCISLFYPEKAQSLADAADSTKEPEWSMSLCITTVLFTLQWSLNE